MRKIGILFALAILLPCGILAGLAFRSIQDQQFVLERQQTLLSQKITDSLAEKIQTQMQTVEYEFGQQVEKLLANQDIRAQAHEFDEKIRLQWPVASVGFAVTLEGTVYSPSSFNQERTQQFLNENASFLKNQESIELYPTSPRTTELRYAYRQNSQNLKSGPEQPFPTRLRSITPLSTFTSPVASSSDSDKEERLLQKQETQEDSLPADQDASSKNLNFSLQEKIAQPPQPPDEQRAASPSLALEGGIQTPSPTTGEAKAFAETLSSSSQPNRTEILRRESSTNRGGSYPLTSSKKKYSNLTQRSVSPQQQPASHSLNWSVNVPEEMKFKELVEKSTSGSLARFLQNQLHILLWYRSPRDPQLIFGTELHLDSLQTLLKGLIRTQEHDPDHCFALLDDRGLPIAISKSNYQTDWKHPFVSSEIMEPLPHWEVAAYLLNPHRFQQTAQTLRITTGSMILLLVLSIGFGGWLIFADVRRQMNLARQKTDFVSNVSHEFRTPLTSIRMFSELLADDRTQEPEKRENYLHIIRSETSRLTRLINNVLDFAKMERGEKKYSPQTFNLVDLIDETVSSYHPHLESHGFTLHWEKPDSPLLIEADRDAVAQILINLLSNAEKYGGEAKTIHVEIKKTTTQIEVYVLDRGLGVPRGSEEKIFEKFHRAHDNLNSGIQGSGLGLTLARQMARAHQGDITYHPREGGGSCFTLKLPISISSP